MSTGRHDRRDARTVRAGTIPWLLAAAGAVAGTGLAVLPAHRPPLAVALLVAAVLLVVRTTRLGVRVDEETLTATGWTCTRRLPLHAVVDVRAARPSGADLHSDAARGLAVLEVRLDSGLRLLLPATIGSTASVCEAAARTTGMIVAARGSLARIAEPGPARAWTRDDAWTALAVVGSADAGLTAVLRLADHLNHDRPTPGEVADVIARLVGGGLATAEDGRLHLGEPIRALAEQALASDASPWAEDGAIAQAHAGLRALSGDGVVAPAPVPDGFASWVAVLERRAWRRSPAGEESR